MSLTYEDMKVGSKDFTKARQIVARSFVNELVDFGMTEKDIIIVAGLLLDSVRERIEDTNNGKMRI